MPWFEYSSRVVRCAQKKNYASVRPKVPLPSVEELRVRTHAEAHDGALLPCWKLEPEPELVTSFERFPGGKRQLRGLLKREVLIRDPTPSPNTHCLVRRT